MCIEKRRLVRQIGFSLCVALACLAFGAPTSQAAITPDSDPNIVITPGVSSLVPDESTTTKSTVKELSKGRSGCKGLRSKSSWAAACPARKTGKKHRVRKGTEVILIEHSIWCGGAEWCYFNLGKASTLTPRKGGAKIRGGKKRNSSQTSIGATLPVARTAGIYDQFGSWVYRNRRLILGGAGTAGACVAGFVTIETGFGPFLICGSAVASWSASW